MIFTKSCKSPFPIPLSWLSYISELNLYLTLQFHRDLLNRNSVLSPIKVGALMAQEDCPTLAWGWNEGGLFPIRDGGYEGTRWYCSPVFSSKTCLFFFSPFGVSKNCAPLVLWYNLSPELFFQPRSKQKVESTATSSTHHKVSLTKPTGKPWISQSRARIQLWQMKV